MSLSLLVFCDIAYRRVMTNDSVLAELLFLLSAGCLRHCHPAVRRAHYSSDLECSTGRSLDRH